MPEKTLEPRDRSLVTQGHGDGPHRCLNLKNEAKTKPVKAKNEKRKSTHLLTSPSTTTLEKGTHTDPGTCPPETPGLGSGTSALNLATERASTICPASSLPCSLWLSTWCLAWCVDRVGRKTPRVDREVARALFTG